MTTLGYIGFMFLFFISVYAALWAIEGAEKNRQRNDPRNWRQWQ